MQKCPLNYSFFSLALNVSGVGGKQLRGRRHGQREGRPRRVLRSMVRTLREAAKKSSSTSGRATERGGG